jgi:hypothetical protein
MTYETVDGATPATAATSLRVTLDLGMCPVPREWLLFGNYGLPLKKPIYNAAAQRRRKNNRGAALTGGTDPGYSADIHESGV